MIWKAMMVSLVGGILCLDRISLQVMISRPVVAGPLTGWMLNDPLTGLVCGAMIELIWMDRLPIGTYIPPNDTMTAVIITAITILMGSHAEQASRELIACSMLAFLPLGYAGQQLDLWGIRSNDKLSKRAISLADRADVRGVSRKHLEAMLKSFVFSILFMFVSITIGSWALAYVFPRLPLFALRALKLSYYFIPLLGIAVALTTIKRQGAITLFCASFAGMLIILEWVYGFSK